MAFLSKIFENEIPSFVLKQNTAVDLVRNPEVAWYSQTLKVFPHTPPVRPIYCNFLIQSESFHQYISVSQFAPYLQGNALVM